MHFPPFGQDKFITVHDLHLHYVEWGTPGNPSMVLLHGFQSNAHTWDTFSSAMAASHHVLALDQRGHGDSARAPDGNYASDVFIRDIIGFIEALHLAPTLLVGHSMGGRHAAMLAAEYPAHIAKVVIVDTAAERPPERRAAFSQQPETAPAAPETFDTFEEVIRQGMAQYPLTPEAELRHANYHNLYRGADGKWRWCWDFTLIEQRRRNRSLQTDLYATLRRVSCPTLLIRGQQSPLLTAEIAQKMLRSLQHGCLEEIANAAHTVNADNAEAFHAITAAFLKT